MSLLSVDPQLCKRDRICIETCPARLIEMKEPQSRPTLIDGAEPFCLRCGHCVAVCPHGAMSHAEMPAGRCPEIRKELALGPEQAEQFLRSRRSIRIYQKKSVARETLERLIEVARYAPSGHNTQPVQWLVVYDRSQVRFLAGLVIDWMRQLVKEGSPLVAMMHLDRVIQGWEAGADRILRGAPHLVLAHAHRDSRTAQAAGTIALAYLELMAPTLGLGACWAGYFTSAALFWPPLLAALELPEGHVVFGSMMVGYPKFKYYRLPERKAPAIAWR